jgi:hypothetical protein
MAPSESLSESARVNAHEGTTVGEFVGARVGKDVGVLDGANDGPLEVGGFVVGISARHSVGRDDFGTCVTKHNQWPRMAQCAMFSNAWSAK